MKTTRLLRLAAGLLAAAALALPARAERELTLGLVAKSQGNPVFQAARIGAQDAAKTLGAKLNLNIKIDWRTPNEEDAQKQAEAIEQLVLSGAEGIAVACSDANKLTDAINAAVNNGVPVATFDSDAPASKRFVTYGVDDIACGQQTMDELAKIKRVVEKSVPIAEVLLVLDATTGQNGLNQAEAFLEQAGVTGLVLTKLDGSARGGFVFAVQELTGIPVKLVGQGEGIDDLTGFTPHVFVRQLLE